MSDENEDRQELVGIARMTTEEVKKVLCAYVDRVADARLSLLAARDALRDSGIDPHGVLALDDDTLDAWIALDELVHEARRVCDVRRDNGLF